MCSSVHRRHVSARCATCRCTDFCGVDRDLRLSRRAHPCNLPSIVVTLGIALPASRVVGLPLGAAIIAAAVLTVLRHRDFSHLVPLSGFAALIALAASATRRPILAIRLYARWSTALQEAGHTPRGPHIKGLADWLHGAAQAWTCVSRPRLARTCLSIHGHCLATLGPLADWPLPECRKRTRSCDRLC